MKNCIVFLSLVILSSRIGYSQSWEEMAQYTIELDSRNDTANLWLNDFVKVELRDFGISQFTIFQDTTSQHAYFIYKCVCNDSILIGGRDRGYDFYRLRDIYQTNNEWRVEDFDTEIALSTPWSLIENRSRRKMKNRCFMNVN